MHLEVGTANLINYKVAPFYKKLHPPKTKHNKKIRFTFLIIVPYNQQQQASINHDGN